LDLGLVRDDSSEKPEHRVQRFRLLAVKARASAGKAYSSLEREEFLRIAKDWEAMAKALEGGTRGSL